MWVLSLHNHLFSPREQLLTCNCQCEVQLSARNPLQQPPAAWVSYLQGDRWESCCPWSVCASVTHVFTKSQRAWHDVLGFYLKKILVSLHRTYLYNDCHLLVRNQFRSWCPADSERILMYWHRFVQSHSCASQWYIRWCLQYAKLFNNK